MIQDLFLSEELVENPSLLFNVALEDLWTAFSLVCGFCCGVRCRWFCCALLLGCECTDVYLGDLPEHSPSKQLVVSMSVLILNILLRVNIKQHMVDEVTQAWQFCLLELGDWHTGSQRELSHLSQHAVKVPGAVVNVQALRSQQWSVVR